MVIMLVATFNTTIVYYQLMETLHHDVKPKKEIYSYYAAS